MQSDQHTLYPIVSIVLINKNHGHFLQATLESYVNQTAQNIQILCIDGLSTDNSLEILNNYKKVTTISEPDRSGSEGLVKGIKRISSKYFMIGTSNDILVDPNFIKSCVAAMEEDDSISCVFGKVLAMSEDGLVGTEIYPYVNGFFGNHTSNFRKWLFYGESFHECAAVFRTNVILECIPNLEIFADGIDVITEDLTLRLKYEFFSQGYKAMFINLAGVAVRDHFDRGSLTNNHYFRQHINVYTKQVESFRKNFLKSRDYSFVDPEGNQLAKLSFFNTFYCLVVLYFLKFKHRLGLLKRKIRPRLFSGDERI